MFPMPTKGGGRHVAERAKRSNTRQRRRSSPPRAAQPQRHPLGSAVMRRLVHHAFESVSRNHEVSSQRHTHTQVRTHALTLAHLPACTHASMHATSPARPHTWIYLPTGLPICRPAYLPTSLPTSTSERNDRAPQRRTRGLLAAALLPTSRGNAPPARSSGNPPGSPRAAPARPAPEAVSCRRFGRGRSAAGGWCRPGGGVALEGRRRPPDGSQTTQTTQERARRATVQKDESFDKTRRATEGPRSPQCARGPESPKDVRRAPT